MQVSELQTRSAGKSNAAVVIPVYVHVITPDDGFLGALSNDAITAQMEMLNHDFAGDSSSSAAKTRFSFKLAGITRTRKTKWFNFKMYSAEEEEAKRALRVGGANALNIYSARPLSGEVAILGFSTFPWQYQLSKSLDGVVINYVTVPEGFKGALDQTFLGRTATHEVGHWLGLYHTFQGGCSGTGDRVADTPREKVAFTCELSRDTCKQQPGLDHVINFMSYAEDCCMSDFTPGQAARMSSRWNVYRSTPT